VSQLRQYQSDVDALGVAVLVVTFEQPARARQYVEASRLPWPLLLDEDRRLYGAFGLERGGHWAVFGPHSWLRYIRLLLRGRRLTAPTGDVHQLGGDVLIDPQGVVRFHHASQSPTDRPRVSAVLDLVRAGG
jgi:peroxiredoxin